jgi:cytochrome c-type biogenesis protein CcmH/NrfG
MTPRYKLRTLLILLAILPPLLWVGWGKYEAWRAEQARQEAIAAEQVARRKAEKVLFGIEGNANVFVNGSGSSMGHGTQRL